MAMLRAFGSRGLVPPMMSLCMVATAAAQVPAGGGMRLSLKLGATATVVYSSNPQIASSTATAADGSGRTATQLLPSIRLTVTGPRLNGNLDYAANVVSVHGDERDTVTYHTARSAARLQVVDDRLAIDGQLQYTQQPGTFFGNPTLGGGLLSSGLPGGAASVANVFNPNVVDVMAAQVAPVVRLRLAGAVDLEARYLRSIVERRGSSLPNDGLNRQDGQGLQASLSGGDVLRWTLQALQQRQDFPNGRSLEGERAVASVSYPLDTDLTVRAGAGVERQNLQSSAGLGQSGTQSRISQLGATWSPTPRTQASIDVVDRFFGTGWQASLSHRLSRMNLRMQGSRSVTDGPLAIGAGPTQAAGLGSITVGELYSQILARAEPNAERRGELVAQALQNRGLDGSATVTGLTQTLSPTLQERLEFGWGYVLPRQTVSFLAARSSLERILKDPLSPSEDLARFGTLTQTVMQAALTHRLTPESTLGLSYGRIRSEAATGALPVQSNQTQLNGTFRLGPRLTGVFLVRDVDLLNPNLSLISTSSGARRRDTSAAFILIPQF